MTWKGHKGHGVSDGFLWSKGGLCLGYMTALRYQMFMAFCLITIVGTGCTNLPKFPAYQSVNADWLEQNQSRVFKIGVVKAVGQYASVSNKKKALEEIPIAEICSLLSSKYSIRIDTAVDKTPKVVREGCETSGKLTGSVANNRVRFSKSIHSWTTNVYYGNLEYEEAGALYVMLFGDCPGIINNNDFTDVVNLTYTYSYEWKDTFYYDINVISSGKEILILHGIVGPREAAPSVAMDISADASDSAEQTRSSYVDYAGRISEALKRDLFETANK